VSRMTLARTLARRTGDLLEQVIVARELARRTGVREAVPTIMDLRAKREAIRFSLDGGQLWIAWDSGFGMTARHLLGVDSLQRLADHVQPEDTVIVDAGAHSGLFSALVKRRNPTCRVVAIEANPQLHSVIRANLGPYSNWELIPKALSDATGPMSFFVNSGATQTSALSQESAEMFGSQSSERITVDSTTIDSLVTELGIDRIDVLKLDIQGAEARALKGASDFLPRIGKLLIEVTFLDESPEDLLVSLREEFGDPIFVQPVAGGADLLYSRV
jgi:FkbM family methyltransferase